MKKKRGVLSLLFVFLWGVLFTLGVYVVFLFLGGFSFFDSRVIQKGYASFSSEFSLYLNAEYIKNSDKYNQYEVGEYVLCVDEFEKDGVCYDEVVVGTNDEVSQTLTSLSLLPKAKKSLVYSLSEVGDLLLFSPDSTAVVWYDASLRQVFSVNDNESGMRSFFPSFEVRSVIYDEKKGQFEFLGKGEQDVFVLSGNRETLLFSSLQKGEYLFSPWFFSIKSDSLGLFDDIVVDLKGVYSSELQNSCFLEKNLSILFFDTSVYLFSEIRDSWVFISEKDVGKEGFCNKKDKKCYFVKNEKLVELSL